ncbi:GP119 protein, partial [Acromyrmex heyeri]
NLSSSNINYIFRSKFVTKRSNSTSMSTELMNATMINEMTQSEITSSEIKNIKILYLYGVSLLMLFCVISIIVNIKILITMFWIKCPLSPTLYISLSLTGADAFSSFFLGIELLLNSFIPIGLGIELKGINCFLLALEVVRLGSVIITVYHLLALANFHKQYSCILIFFFFRKNKILLILLWMLPISFFAVYFNLIENNGFQSEGCRNNMFLRHQKFRIVFSNLVFWPFILMVYIYIHILYIVKRHQTIRLRFYEAGSPAQIRAALRKNSNIRQMTRNFRAVHTTLYILGSFVVGWMPAVITFVLVCDDCILQLNRVSARVIFFIHVINNGLIILKTLVNPIIYAAQMDEIKIATRRMHDAFCGWSKLTHFTTARKTNSVRKRTETEKSIGETAL